MDWWNSKEISIRNDKVQLTCTPCQHFCPCPRMLALYELDII
jgi:hypothetical protein